MLSFNKNVFWSAVAVFAAAIGLSFHFYGEILLNPTAYLFSAEGDGLKNYYTVAYQVIHGNGLWFEGMLYPYGDHLTFADGQPLLTKICKLFVETTPENGHLIIGLMNLLMIGSLVVTAWCVHRLLVWSEVNAWYAVPFALAIAFLSPQIARFTGHYALGYTCFVPLCWLAIVWLERALNPWFIALAAGLFVIASAFLHPYFLFLFILFFGATLFWNLLTNSIRTTGVKHFGAKLFLLIIPLAVFMFYQKIADPYIDRPSTPFGMYDYVATLQSVFAPIFGPLHDILPWQFGYLFPRSPWEGNAYIGLVASGIFFLSIGLFLFRWIFRKEEINSKPPQTISLVLIPSVLTLLFAMGVFHKLGLEWLSEFISPIKQFRSLGRMAWIFYYVASVWAVYQLYRLTQNENPVLRKIGIIASVLGIVLWFTEASINVRATNYKLLNETALESFSDEVATEWKNAGLIIEDHQAILPLPLHLVGSEKIGLGKGQESLHNAMRGSFSTGLSIIGGAMSRTSYEVTEKTAQLVGDSLLPRSILYDMTDDKKLLILQSSEPLNFEEQRLIGMSELVYECADYSLHSVSVAELRYLYSELLVLPDSVTFSKPNYIKPKKAEQLQETLWSAETYKVQVGCILIDTVIADSVILNISYWVKADSKQELLPNRVFDADQEWKISGSIGSNPNLLDGWLLHSEDLQMEAGKHHAFMIDARPGIISRIMLREADETVIHKEPDGTVFINNIPVRD